MYLMIKNLIHKKKEDLGGCNLFSDKDIPIEIKKSTSPDWMQCSLKYYNNTNKWIGSLKNI